MDEPVHDLTGADKDTEQAALRQRTLVAAILAHADADSVDELVAPEESES